MKFFDTHCHLNLSPLYDEFAQVVETLKAHNCYANIVGIDLPSSMMAVQQAVNSPNLYATVGIHPTNATKINDDQLVLKYLRILLEQRSFNKVVALGETGFDFYRTEKADYQQAYAIQKKWFDHHVKLAQEFDVPLIIHVRDAHEEMLAALKQIHHYGIIHCFNQDWALAQEYLSLGSGWMLSIPGVITYKNAKALQEAVKQIPLSRLLVETDAPWLAPTPHRGKTNYPHYCWENIKWIADLKAMSVSDVAQQLWKNSLKIFKIKQANPLF